MLQKLGCYILLPQVVIPMRLEVAAVQLQVHLLRADDFVLQRVLNCDAMNRLSKK
jgi:hypothetical protein